jgi:hypothetical protein
MMNKKAENPVTTLIIIIGVLIVLYVLVMPPCDKCELLNTDCPSYCEDESGASGDVLLNVEPGDVSLSDKRTYDLGSINLYSHSEPDVDRLSNSLSVSKGWFGAVDQDLTFNVDSFSDLESAQLSFVVVDSRGDLNIYLNDRQVFSDGISSGRTVEVDLPVSYLEEVNELRLESETPGLAFWVRNYYDLRDVEILKSFEIVHSSDEKSFFISDQEYDALDEAELEFTIHCSSLEGEAQFKIYLNDELSRSDTIGCISRDISMSVDYDSLNEGTNTVRFLVDNGDFLLSDIGMEVWFDESVSPSYEFDVDRKTGNEFELYMKFDSSDDEKRGNINLNGHTIEFDTSLNVFRKDITSYVDLGTNYLEIRPDNNFEIDRLKVSIL